MKAEVSQKALWGISTIAVVVVVGFLLYLFRASDPAAHGPIPYKKFDYGTHMQEQLRQYNRQPPSAAGTPSQSHPSPR